MMIESDFPFRVFKTQNFEPTDIKLVVTAADTENRIVHELNAEPAASEYASAIGLLPDDLGPFSFASYPLVVKVGGDYYCRSIRNMNPDGSLSFFCAIDEGLVFTVARPRDMLSSTTSVLEELDATLGGVDLVVGFDCILRRLDAETRQIRHQMDELYQQILGRRLSYLRRAVQRHAPEPDPHRHRLRAADDGTLSMEHLLDKLQAEPHADELERQVIKLQKINAALMQRVERSMEQQANAYSLFQTAITLEGQVRVRTEELKNALSRLERTNDELTSARDTSERANRFKTRFFTAVGHDLLQPLHAARLSASALAEPSGNVDQRRIADRIEHALTTIEDLLKSILDISKLEAGVITPALRPVPLDELFASLSVDIEPLGAREEPVVDLAAHRSLPSFPTR